MEIKKATRQQNHASAAERLQMVEQFRRSGLTRVAFSRQHGIPLATLNWWLAKTKRTPNLPVPVIFSEVMLPPHGGRPTNEWAMELTAPSGLTVRWREVLPIRDLERVLRGVRC